VDDAAMASIKYFAIYYGADWCPPCHAFTPKLVQFYNSFKPTHPDFELIFVSEDRSADALLVYMEELNMPWPAVRFNSLRHDGVGTFKGSGIEAFAGDTIPDLVLVDSNGQVLSDSYLEAQQLAPAGPDNPVPLTVNRQYIGPNKVLDDIQAMVK
jgi:thiol-disulfide isomerase/thioredoxin